MSNARNKEEEDLHRSTHRTLSGALRSTQEHLWMMSCCSTFLFTLRSVNSAQ